jgi:hypothetical protein
MYVQFNGQLQYTIPSPRQLLAMIPFEFKYTEAFIILFKSRIYSQLPVGVLIIWRKGTVCLIKNNFNLHAIQIMLK